MVNTYFLSAKYYKCTSALLHPAHLKKLVIERNITTMAGESIHITLGTSTGHAFACCICCYAHYLA